MTTIASKTVSTTQKAGNSLGAAVRGAAQDTASRSHSSSVLFETLMGDQEQSEQPLMTLLSSLFSGSRDLAPDARMFSSAETVPELSEADVRKVAFLQEQFFGNDNDKRLDQNNDGTLEAAEVKTHKEKATSEKTKLTEEKADLEKNLGNLQTITRIFQLIDLIFKFVMPNGSPIQIILDQLKQQEAKLNRDLTDVSNGLATAENQLTLHAFLEKKAGSDATAVSVFETLMKADGVVGGAKDKLTRRDLSIAPLFHEEDGDPDNKTITDEDLKAITAKAV